MAKIRQLQRLENLLSGTDAPGHRPLPASELLHPAPLFAVIVLVVNDRLLKGSAMSGWLTGKLSDFAGLFVFPLLLTAAANTVLWLATSHRGSIDYTLRRYKLAIACTATAALFTATKLSPAAAAWVASVLPGQAHITPDPTDLLALPAVAVAYWHGMREIARIPRGRVQLYLSTGNRAIWRDIQSPTVLINALDRYKATGDAGPAQAALTQHRE